MECFACWYTRKYSTKAVMLTAIEFSARNSTRYILGPRWSFRPLVAITFCRWISKGGGLVVLWAIYFHEY